MKKRNRRYGTSRGYAAIGLDNPKIPANVGGVLRAAGCYGAPLVVVGGKRNAYRPAPTDVQRYHRHNPLILVPDVFDAMPYDCVPVAVDLVAGARCLGEYTHPERAFYVFGAEDATLGGRVLERCLDVIYVPTVFCMNLAATVNVVLYDRAAKRGWPTEPDPAVWVR